MDKFDLVLQKSAINIAPREHLTGDTMNALQQVKRARSARRVLLAAVIIAFVLLIAKWLNNELVYLIILAFNKFSLVRSQSFLYLQVLFESLPKPQLFAICVASILWLLWNKFETFVIHTRITNRKTAAMKVLKMTPRLLVANTLLIVIILGFSGYSYAQKEEQKKLEILKQYINPTGRTEIETNMSCDSRNQNLTNLYEVHKNAKLNPDEAKFAIEALCNMDQAEKFARKIISLLKLSTSSPLPGPAMKRGDTYYSISTGIYYKVTELKDGFLYGDDMFDGDGPYGDNPPLPIDLAAKAYELGVEKPLPISSAKKGVIVMPIEMIANVAVSQSGSSAKARKVIALIVLPDKPEFKWYHPNMINSVSRVQTCEGNPQDRCIDTGKIDLFPAGAGEGDFRNAAFTPLQYPSTKNSPVMKEISGKLTEINNKYVKIKSSSGRVFTVRFESNPVEYFNKNVSQHHNNIKIELGDTIVVRYSESSDKHATTIENKQIMNASFAIEMTSKYDSVKKY
jgi:hypothetical protein